MYDREAAYGNSIPEWLRHGRLSLTQARERADELADIWRALHDPERCKSDPVPDFGFEPFIGHKIANHVLPWVLAHYNHNSYEMQREQALKTWADRIEALANSKNVVQLQRTA